MNNEEINARSGICCWTNEQAFRELYLRPSELSAKLGGANGVMSAIDRYDQLRKSGFRK